MDISDIVLSSAYDTDKIVFTQRGSVAISSLPVEYTAGGFTIYRLTIPHGKPRPLFIDIRFSNDGGATWKTGGSNEAVIGFSTSTTLNVLVQNSLSGTLLYEVFGSWINDYDTSNPAIAPIDADSNTYFDSRLNYRKVLTQGRLNTVYVPADFRAYGTVAHGLGRYARYSIYNESRPGEIWQEHSGGIKNPWLFDFAMNQCLSYSTTSNVEIETDFAGAVWYKVYADE